MPTGWTSTKATRTSPPSGEVVLVVAMEAEDMLPIKLMVLIAILTVGYASTCKINSRVEPIPSS